jgi:hypothetical protein
MLLLQSMTTIMTRSPNLHEIYERHLSFSLSIIVVAVLFLLLDARAALAVARAQVHMKKIVELRRSIRTCKISLPFIDPLYAS